MMVQLIILELAFIIASLMLFFLLIPIIIPNIHCLLHGGPFHNFAQWVMSIGVKSSNSSNPTFFETLEGKSWAMTPFSFLSNNIHWRKGCFAKKEVDIKKSCNVLKLCNFWINFPSMGTYFVQSHSVMIARGEPAIGLCNAKKLTRKSVWRMENAPTLKPVPTGCIQSVLKHDSHKTLIGRSSHAFNDDEPNMDFFFTNIRKSNKF